MVCIETIFEGESNCGVIGFITKLLLLKELFKFGLILVTGLIGGIINENCPLGSAEPNFDED